MSCTRFHKHSILDCDYLRRSDRPRPSTVVLDSLTAVADMMFLDYFYHPPNPKQEESRFGRGSDMPGTVEECAKQAYFEPSSQEIKRFLRAIGNAPKVSIDIETPIGKKLVDNMIQNSREQKIHALPPIVGRMSSHTPNLDVMPKLNMMRSTAERKYRRKLVGSMKNKGGRFMVWQDGDRKVVHLIFNRVNPWPMSRYGEDLLGRSIHYWNGRGSPTVKGTVTAIGCERGLLVVSVRV